MMTLACTHVHAPVPGMEKCQSNGRIICHPNEVTSESEKGHLRLYQDDNTNEKCPGSTRTWPPSPCSFLASIGFYSIWFFLSLFSPSFPVSLAGYFLCIHHLPIVLSWDLCSVPHI